MKFCQRCGATLFGGHPCHCRLFKAYHDNWGEWLTFYGIDPEEAAEAAAKKYWEDDPPEDEDTVEVLVRRPGEPITAYIVEAVYRIDYRARPGEENVVDPDPEDLSDE